MISGATGLIGTALSSALEARGDEVRVLSRSGGAGRFAWDPALGRLESGAIEGCDAVVHLAGRSLLTPWTPAAKRDFRSSRVDGGALLASEIAKASRSPSTFVTASAVGYYGSRGDERLDETSGAGTGFLAELGVAWEQAALAAADVGVRVAAIRTGIVLRSLVKPLRLPFSLGLGAQLGDGSQWMSWVRLEDLVSAYLHVLDHPELSGPFNAAAPEPVTNAEFTVVLARTLRRPAFLAAPAFALRLMAGREFADETLLASQRVVPARLTQAGFDFRWPRLEPAISDLLAG